MTKDAQLREPNASGLVDAYRIHAGDNDELVDATGALRPKWTRLLQGIDGLSVRERSAQMRRLERQVLETGLAHDVFADPTGARQQWLLNLMPLVISAEEWRWLEGALLQRSRLMSLVLADIYGPQTLLERGLIPPSLIFSDRAYLRPCHDVQPKFGHLQFYALDLARGPDGHWRVIDSHAETPAGLGYAVANRTLHADVASDLIATCGIRRLSWHFQEMQDTFQERAGRAQPSVAVLTPGPDHDDYFSHAYLARYLGYELVEGGDLRVIGDQVFLKTLGGLKPIDCLLRCTDGLLSDPLELDPSGFLGPSGLMQACRATPELCANTLGSSVIENRGLGGYLPRLCQELLGEALMLWDAPRWWLGDPQAQSQIAISKDDFVIRHTREGTGRPGSASPGRRLSTLSSAERQALSDEIRMHGTTLVAEQIAGFGTTPVMGPAGLRPRSFAIRLFVSRSTDGFAVLPGGIAMGVDPVTSVALHASDGETQDIWVESDEQEKPHTSLWQPHVEAALTQRSQRALQSRVADNLFWLGRYLERSDWTMRVIRSALSRRMEYLGAAPRSDAGELCLNLLLAKTVARPRTPAADADVHSMLQLTHMLLTQRDSTFSLVTSFEGIYRAASLTRDRLSLETWRSLASFRVNDAWIQRMREAGISEILDEIEDRLATAATFSGHMHENMTRNVGWRFLDMGRRLERAYNLADVMHLLFSEIVEEDATRERVRHVLDLADSYITYRSRYRLEPMLPLALDLLLVDETNPRSIGYQLARMAAHLEELPQPGEGNKMSRERRLLLGLQTNVRLADVMSLGATGAEAARRERLELLLQQAQNDLPELSQAISRRYFRLVDDEPHRVRTRTEPHK